ncbi:hypothetical protein KSC_032770 [Ktedonobacter sp. SOSP1-52]|nr:hypothetical protein KSC_032770 [Ktedonobacter sp. SOSP1-52]
MRPDSGIKRFLKTKQKGFTGFYYYYAYARHINKHIKSYVGSWQAIKNLVGQTLAQNSAWKLDPSMGGQDPLRHP